jgi:hypothetical protein
MLKCHIIILSFIVVSYGRGVAVDATLLLLQQGMDAVGVSIVDKLYKLHGAVLYAKLDTNNIVACS